MKRRHFPTATVTNGALAAAALPGGGLSDEQKNLSVSARQLFGVS